MENTGQTSLEALLDQLRGAWRYRWQAVLVAAAVAVVGWCVVFAMPDKYLGSAELLVNSRTALQPLLEGVAADQDVSSQLTYVRQSLLVDAQLCRIAVEAGFPTDCATNLQSQQGMLSGLRNSIKLDVADVGQGQLGYKISYWDTDRARAQRLVAALLSTFETRTLGGKRQGAEDAQKFLATQLQDAQQRLHESEDRLAAFKARHVGVLPTDDGGYSGQVQKETQAADDAQTRLVAAQNRRATLENQLRVAAATATAPVLANGTGGTTSVDTASQIVAAQAHLDDLLLKYTDKHPDVIAAREQLKELKRRRAAEVQGAQRGDATAVTASGASSNPVYQSIQLSINQADVDIAELRGELEQHQAKVRELKQMLNSEPQVEAEFGQLSRAYDADKAQFAALQDSYNKSKLGEQAASAADNVHFRVVQAPMVSFDPVSPRRSLMLTGVLVLALAAGCLLAYGLDQLHPVVGSAGALTRLTGVPVLVAVGSAFPSQTAAAHRRQVWQVAFAVAVLAGALVVSLMLSGIGVRIRF